MPEDFLAAQFEENRAHLTRVAYRMLGSTAEADDAVQEAWIRLSRSDTSEIENLPGWLTHGDGEDLPEHASVSRDPSGGRVGWPPPRPDHHERR